ncbi:MAG TPA: FkbM family methyltransferase [Verrucomicrobiae bacterium]|jgi:FkbM family methyltransferase|nr:FkbM family methyltransferase [Verrucomicrobiae bacterium]
MNVLYNLGNLGWRVKEILPVGMKNSLLDCFFKYAPIWLIRALWEDIDGYFVIKTPSPGDVLVDAGAWTGHVTIVTSRMVGPKGTVVAIEPQKEMSERLRQRLDHLGINNVIVVNAALFDKQCNMAVSKNPTSGFTVLEQADSFGASETISLRTLDDIVASLGLKQLNFIKMDIEGAELEALKGAESTIKSMRPFCAIASYHMREGADTSRRVEEILKTNNYSARTGHPRHLTTWGWYGNETA